MCSQRVIHVAVFMYSVALNFTLLVSEVSHFFVSVVLLKHFPFFHFTGAHLDYFSDSNLFYAEIFLIIKNVLVF